MLTGRWSLLKYMLPALLLAAVPAQGAVFMWKDSAGIAHYTNKEYDVPARYKAKAKVLYPDASDARSVPPGNTAVQAAPLAPPVPASQDVKPAGPPDVRPAAPPVQVTSTPPKAPERRGRRQRERDDE